jgi:hypothetical protein
MFVLHHNEIGGLSLYDKDIVDLCVIGFLERGEIDLALLDLA